MNRQPPVGLVVGFAVLALAASADVAAAQAPPSLTADQYSVAEGAYVRVSGAGWSAIGNGLVSVQICGNGAVDASADCDLAGTAAGGVREGGSFYTGITVHLPPKPCPCVLRAYTTGSGQEVTIPIEIAGMPTAIPTPALGVTRGVTVSDLSIDRSDPWTTLLGAPPSREVVFTVTNSGDVLLHDPPVTLAWGRGDAPDGLMDAPVLGDLAPGQTVVSRVEVPMGVLSFGNYRVTVVVAPLGGEPVATSVETSSYPWLLIVASVVLLQLVLIGMRNRYRRRHSPPPGPQLEASDPFDPTADDVEPRADPVLAFAGNRPSWWQTIGTVFGAAVLVGALAGCGGSSGSDSSSEDLSSDPDCVLTVEQAADLLPVEPTATDLPPAGTDPLFQPSSRCRYEGGGWNLQLTVYPGGDPFEQLQSLVGTPEPGSTPDDGARCGTNQAETDSVVSCLLMAGGDTMALVLRVPNSEVDGTLEPRIRELAAVLANDL